MEDLRQADKEILKAMNHTLIETPKVEMPPMDLDKPDAAPKQTPTQKKATAKEEVLTENRVLIQLRQTFGLDKIKKTDVIFNSMFFTLKAINAYWLSWADSYALLAVVDKDGNFNRLEYEAAFKVYLSAGYIDKIDGLDIKEVFGEADEKVARIKLATFLMNESSDILGKKLYETYDAEIEPYAKVVAGLSKQEEALGSFKCPKCSNVMAYEKRDKAYFCHLDGTKMRPFKMEDNLPLP